MILATFEAIISSVPSSHVNVLERSGGASHDCKYKYKHKYKHKHKYEYKHKYKYKYKKV